MVKSNSDGSVGLVIPPQAAAVRRQDVPVVYDMTTVGYVARPDFVMTQTGLFAGRVRRVHVPVERALDIDTPLDFHIAESLVSRADGA
jgi:N-acylneuraminate cytidylyltransferase